MYTWWAPLAVVTRAAGHFECINSHNNKETNRYTNTVLEHTRKKNTIDKAQQIKKNNRDRLNNEQHHTIHTWSLFFYSAQTPAASFQCGTATNHPTAQPNTKASSAMAPTATSAVCTDRADICLLYAGGTWLPLYSRVGMGSAVVTVVSVGPYWLGWPYVPTLPAVLPTTGAATAMPG